MHVVCLLHNWKRTDILSFVSKYYTSFSSRRFWFSALHSFYILRGVSAQQFVKWLSYHVMSGCVEYSSTQLEKNISVHFIMFLLSITVELKCIFHVCSTNLEVTEIKKFCDALQAKSKHKARSFYMQNVAFTRSNVIFGTNKRNNARLV